MFYVQDGLETTKKMKLIPTVLIFDSEQDAIACAIKIIEKGGTSTKDVYSDKRCLFTRYEVNKLTKCILVNDREASKGFIVSRDGMKTRELSIEEEADLVCTDVVAKYANA